MVDLLTDHAAALLPRTTDRKSKAYRARVVAARKLRKRGWKPAESALTYWREKAFRVHGMNSGAFIDFCETAVLLTPNIDLAPGFVLLHRAPKADDMFSTDYPLEWCGACIGSGGIPAIFLPDIAARLVGTRPTLGGCNEDSFFDDDEDLLMDPAALERSFWARFFRLVFLCHNGGARVPDLASPYDFSFWSLSDLR
ncbi:hypothetical protein HK405_013951 [Cladochytrium tenue]|nr:hypothetical protein HK405_013951 [Cladochytrium tenue]